MSIAPALGLTSGRKVRDASVALGDLTQEAMLPGVAHTGDSDKASGVGKPHGVTEPDTYERFDDLLASGTIDAIYRATPNWRHAEFAIPALKAGAPVALEPFTRTKRIDTTAQAGPLRARTSPALVDTATPGKGREKVPKN